MRLQILLSGIALTVAGLSEDAMIQGAPAAEAAARMQVPDGFAVDLIAAEPDIVQPIAMCFDARGRIWVAEGMSYPTRAKEGQGKDRIVILEDADGDGQYETRKIFAEGLNLVSGIEVGFGGLYVGAAPYLMFLADADGDDRADGQPEILLDGWGYEDTHETLNSFTWGPDGWLYGCHGVFTHSRVGKPGTPEEERVPLNAGVWRFHPVTEEFEVFAHGTSNPWGLDFNDWGEAFIEACVIPHLWHVIPGGYYQRQAGSHFNPHIYDPLETIADHRHWVGDLSEHAHWGHENAISKGVSDAGGGHAHCGFAICLSDAFPPEMRGSAIFFNIHGHRLNRDVLERRGSGWVGRHAPDLMLAKDEWFIGVAIEAGPDGALYFTDWHDDTSCHRPNPERWDRDNGRVYRLRYGEVKPWQGDLTNLSDLELAKYQAGRDEWALRTARRILQERVAGGRAMDPQAKGFLMRTLRHHEDVTRRLRAMWCLAVCDELEGDHSDDPSEWIRAWSVRLARDGVGEIAGGEEAPVVLLALCSAMQRVPDAEAWEVAEKIAPKMVAEDPNLTRMFWFGFERLVARDASRSLEIALSCPDERLLEWTARRMDSPEALVAACAIPGTKTAAILQALERRLEAWPDDRLTPEQLAVIGRLREVDDPAVRELAASIFTRGGDHESLAKLWQALEDRGAPTGDRKRALGVLAGLWDEGDQARLAGLIDDPAMRLPVLLARPSLLDEDATRDRIAGFTPEEKMAVSRLVTRQGKAELLLEWLAAEKLREQDVPADAVARLREIREPSMRREVIRRWGEVSADQAARRAQISEWRDKLTPEVMERADANNGRMLYERTCAACHKLFGEGGELGPELTGGERGSLSHWLENIVDPNALIGAGYELHQIEKHDGTMVVGMLAAENDDELILKMVGLETRVPKEEVKTNKSLGSSMMPEGLINGMSDQEVRDLMAYLMSPAQVSKP